MKPEISLAQQLIIRPSVTPSDGGCQALLGERLERSGFECEHMRFEDVDNLWARLGTDGPVFVFAGHTDVVPTEDPALWKYPPFGAEIADGKLWGRGAADMKSSIAAMVVATEQFLAKHQHNIRGSIAFLLTSDEEGPATNGTVKVIDALSKRGEKIDWCIVGEPTSTNRTGDVIKNGRRGSMNGEITVHGSAGHVAYPHLADNPIHRIGKLIDLAQEEVWDEGNEFFPATTFQVSNISAGTGATNVIPSTASMVFNFRFSPESTADELQARLQSLCDLLKIKADIQWTVSGHPFQTEPADLIAAVTSAIEDQLNLSPELSTTGGTSDARFIAPTGAQVIELGPPNATIHKVNEHVNVADIESLTLAYEKTLENLLLVASD